MTLGDLIRKEADMAARFGQLGRLQAIANHVDDLQAEVDRLRAEVEKQKLIAESFKQAAADIAAACKAEMDVLWNVIEASHD